MAGLTKQQKADKALIEENPNATPQELMTLGLSPDGYEKMIAEKGESKVPEQEEETAPPVKAHPVQPVVQDAPKEPRRAVPQLQSYTPPKHDGMVNVRFPDGTVQQWPRATAERYKRGGRNATTQILD